MSDEDDAPQASAYLRFLWGSTGPPRPGRIPDVPVVPKRPARQCVNAKGEPKSRHRSKGDATYALKRLKKRPGFKEDPRRPIHAYNCPLCGFWHVGRTPEEERNDDA